MIAANPVEAQDSKLPSFTFNRSIEVVTQNQGLGAEIGALLLRQMDDRVKLTETIVASVTDPRKGRLPKFSMAELIRTRMYLIAQGWANQDDADCLRNEPSLKVSISDHKGTYALEQNRGLPSQPTLSRHNQIMASEPNRKALSMGLVHSTLQALNQLPALPEQLTLDFDSLMHETSGCQGGVEYNGHYHYSGYQILYAYLYEASTFVAANLRPGTTYTSEDCDLMAMQLLDELEAKTGKALVLRADAGFTSDKFMTQLENRRSKVNTFDGTRYCFRIKGNGVLDKMARPYLTVSRGPKPKIPRQWYVELTYQAAEWKRSRRVVLVIKENFNSLTQFDFFYLITNFTIEEKDAQEVHEFYRRRAVLEGDLGQLMSTIAPALSCSERKPLEQRKSRDEDAIVDAIVSDMNCNEANLYMHLLAFNLMRIGTTLMKKVAPSPDQAQTGHVPDPKRIKKNGNNVELRWGWSLQRFRDQVLKHAAIFTVRSRYIQMRIAAEASELWQRMLRAIETINQPPTFA